MCACLVMVQKYLYIDLHKIQLANIPCCPICFINCSQVYFDYVELLMAGLQDLPEMPKRLKNVLEDEWRFTKHVCPYIRCGESNAGNRFR